MDHYIDIKLLPDPEFQPTMLMGALFNKLHRALAELQSNRIAVSFVQYQAKGKHKSLGDVLRLHGDEGSLHHLLETNWLRGMSDHIDKSAIQPVPEKHGFMQVKRVQCKSNVERLRSRYAKRHDVSMAEAAKALPDAVEQRLDLPFVVVKSSSTAQQFRLFIRQSEVAESMPNSTFNCYGLSGQGVVPAF